MPVSIVQKKTSGAFNGFTFTSNVTAGNILVVVVEFLAGDGTARTITGFSDTQGNTWTSRVNINGPNDSGGRATQSWIYTGEGGTAGADTISITFSGSQADGGTTGYEISGATVTDLATATGSGTTETSFTTSTSISFTGSPMLIAGGYFSGAGAMSAGTGFTSDGDTRFAESATTGITSPTSFPCSTASGGTAWAYSGIMLPATAVTVFFESGAKSQYRRGKRTR